MLVMLDKFGERLRDLREGRGLTQKELGQIVKLSPSTIGMYESGRRDPDSDTLRILAEYFGVTADFLLGRSDDRDHSKSSPILDIALEWPEGYRILSRGVREMDTQERNRLIEVMRAVFPERFKDDQ